MRLAHEGDAVELHRGDVGADEERRVRATREHESLPAPARRPVVPVVFPFSERIRSRQTLLRAVRRVVYVVHQHQPGLGAVLVDGADPRVFALLHRGFAFPGHLHHERRGPREEVSLRGVHGDVRLAALDFARAHLRPREQGHDAVEILRGRLALKVRRGAVHDVARPVDPLGAEGFVYAYVCAHVERDASFERPVRRPHLGLVPVLHLFEGAVVQLEVVERIERGPPPADSHDRLALLVRQLHEPRLYAPVEAPVPSLGERVRGPRFGPRRHPGLGIGEQRTGATVLLRHGDVGARPRFQVLLGRG